MSRFLAFRTVSHHLGAVRTISVVVPVRGAYCPLGVAAGAPTGPVCPNRVQHCSRKLKESRPMKRAISHWSLDLAFAALAFSVLVSGVLTNGRVSAQARPSREATFTKDIAPILQRSCQECHRPDGVAPMPLLTYADARPYARSIKARTAARWQRGAMPPWFVEKNIGIQNFKNDPSLNDEEVATIARWVDSGAPQGDPADMPPPRHFESSDKWTIGEPDLVLKSVEITVPAVGPDKWTDLGLIPTGLTESRYASAVEVREVNDVPAGNNSNTVGGRFVFHHMTYS